MLADKLGSLAVQLVRDKIDRITFMAPQSLPHLLTLATLKGALQHRVQNATIVNAADIAQEQGIGIGEEVTGTTQDFTDAIGVRIHLEDKELNVWGAVLPDGAFKVTRCAGYRIEESVYGDNTWIAYFPVRQENFERSKTDVSIWEQVENVAQMQYYWADNQVSVTVTFTPEEAGDIPKILELYETRLKGISFLPLTDHSYPQAPYQEISQEMFDQAVAKLGLLDFDELNTDEAQDMFCDGEKCELVIPEDVALPKEMELTFDDAAEAEAQGGEGGPEIGASN